MGGGLSTDCGRKNMGFSTPFGAVFGIKSTIGLILWCAAMVKFKLVSYSCSLSKIISDGIMKSEIKLQYVQYAHQA